MALTPIDKLDKVIMQALEDYQNDVSRDVATVTKKVAKAGADAVKASAKTTFKGTGKYASGWTSTIDEGRVRTVGVIYNSKVPGLPHLLENGHAKRGGGRVEGRPHIKPVEEKIAADYEEQIVKVLT